MLNTVFRNKFAYGFISLGNKICHRTFRFRFRRVEIPEFSTIYSDFGCTIGICLVIAIQYKFRYFLKTFVSGLIALNTERSAMDFNISYLSINNLWICITAINTFPGNIVISSSQNNCLCFVLY